MSFAIVGYERATYPFMLYLFIILHFYHLWYLLYLLYLYTLQNKILYAWMEYFCDVLRDFELRRFKKRCIVEKVVECVGMACRFRKKSHFSVRVSVRMKLDEKRKVSK